MTALLLNATFEPLTLVKPNRAVRLVMDDRVDVIESGERLVRAATVEIPEPLVLHLREFVKVPFKTNPPISRRAVFLRDGFKCVYCGDHAETLDHVTPRAHGGRHEWANVVAACRPCNLRKADRFLSDIGWELRFTPRQPSGSFWVLISAKSINPAWERWL